ncbi:peptide chain release factor N(5)-glutamine methyltransferase [Candidatus Falkowbacteria bacterium]|nr:peptide chain release factor N(5)-glutamine methyltransferase [Candidatus Falkowbacteria bacterium]
MSLSINAALTLAAQKLAAARITSPHLDADVLLSFVLKKSKEFLYSHSEQILKRAQYSKYKKLINQRARYFPVAYLTNHKEFFGLDFYVDKNVLIPRPETELLVERALRAMETIKNKNATIADIGTGSGCVAISIAKNINARVFAVDISSTALKIARKNARAICTDAAAAVGGVNMPRLSRKKIKFLHGNLLEPLKNKKLDIIIANLPYWYDNDMKNLLKSSWSKSIKYEPQIAIKGGKTGLSIYRKFFQQISQLKYRPKYILTEIDHRQTKSISAFIKKILPNSKIQVFQDLNKKDRVIVVTI